MRELLLKVIILTRIYAPHRIYRSMVMEREKLDEWRYYYGIPVLLQPEMKTWLPGMLPPRRCFWWLGHCESRKKHMDVGQETAAETIMKNASCAPPASRTGHYVVRGQWCFDCLHSHQGYPTPSGISSWGFYTGEILWLVQRRQRRRLPDSRAPFLHAATCGHHNADKAYF